MTGQEPFRICACAPATTNFFLRDAHTNQAKTVFRLQDTVSQPGLYRVTLPETVRLRAGNNQRWQDDQGRQADVAGVVLLEVDPRITRAIAQAKNELEKAILGEGKLVSALFILSVVETPLGF